MKKKVSVILTTILIASVLVGCGSASASNKDTDKQQQNQQEEMLQQANDQLGMPNITNFQEKKMLKQIMELTDKSDLICYVYSFSEFTGKYNYIGKSVGFGIPYGTEYTNPEKMGTVDGGQYSALNPYTMPQADPNGLFKATDVQATWICMIDDATGEKYIMYSEPNMTISAHKLPKSVLNSIPDNY
jgi:hypothetical protein